MTANAQLPLALAHRPALSDEDFLVAPANAEAVAWIDRWPDWPSPLLCVVGPPGCGKTHLARVFMARSGARLVAATDLSRLSVAVAAEGAPALVIEDADAALSGEREVALLHGCNWIAETGRWLLLTAQRAPSRWETRLPDLRSRLNAAPVATIGPPDDALLAAVLVKLFADRQLKVDGGVVSAMLSRIERSFEGARRAVEAVDRAALARRRNITVPLVREVLAEGRGNG